MMNSLRDGVGNKHERPGVREDNAHAMLAETEDISSVAAQRPTSSGCLTTFLELVSGDDSGPDEFDLARI